MLVYFRVGERFGLVYALVIRTYRRPVTGHFFHGVDVQVGLAVGAAQRIVQRVHARLARAAGKGRVGCVYDIDVGSHGAAQCRDAVARTVVRMEVYRQVDRFFQSRNEAVRRFRLEQAGHILDGDDVGAGVLQFLRHVDVVRQVVFRAGAVEDIAGVAQGDFGDLARFADGLNRAVHVVQAVEAVENTEYVDAVFRRQFDEVLDDVVRIARVAYGVCAADEHLKQNVRRFFAHLAEAFPRIFIEEAIGNVEGRAAPAFVGEELRQLLGCRFEDAEHIDGADAGSHQGLVGVTHRRIRNQNFFLVENPLGELFRPHGIENLLRAGRILTCYSCRHFQSFEFRFFLMTSASIAVNRRFTDVFQQLRAAVLYDGQVKQFRMVVNEVDIVRTVHEFRRFQHVDEEADVRLNAADTEFFQRTQHFLHSPFMGQRICRSLNEKGIIVRRNNRAGIRIAAVETDAEAAAAAVYHNFARIRHKVVHRVFCRNTALDGVALAMNRFLRRNGNFLAVQRIAFGHFYLGLYNIDTRDHFRDSMFYLYAGVNFDKVEFFIRCNKEFDRAGIDIVDVLHELDRRVANVLAELFRQGKGRGDFDNLLMTALNRAVPFE